jgi:hypothetical protein
MWEQTSFVVYCHIEGEDQPFGRMQYPDEKEGRSTPESVITNLRDWHSKYWATVGKKLIFDAVLFVHESGSEIVGMQTQSFEVYRFPVGY